MGKARLNMKWHTLLLCSMVGMLLGLAIGGCRPTTPAAPSVPSFQLTSTAFSAGQPIPAIYTCDGQDISPPLQWTEPPAGTKAFALIVEDPDAPAGTWIHWVLYGLPATARQLSEAMPSEGQLADGSRHGRNSWQKLGYGGPCPPSGTHRYFFRLYALDVPLDLAAGASKKQLLAAMEGHILAMAELMGTYSRK